MTDSFPKDRIIIGNNFPFLFLKHHPNVFLLPVLLLRIPVPVRFLSLCMWPAFSIRELLRSDLEVYSVIPWCGSSFTDYTRHCGPPQYRDSWPAFLENFFDLCLWSFLSLSFFFLQCLLFGYGTSRMNFLLFSPSFHCCFLPFDLFLLLFYFFFSLLVSDVQQSGSVTVILLSEAVLQVYLLILLLNCLILLSYS